MSNNPKTKPNKNNNSNKKSKGNKQKKKELSRKEKTEYKRKRYVVRRFDQLKRNAFWCIISLIISFVVSPLVNLPWLQGTVTINGTVTIITKPMEYIFFWLTIWIIITVVIYVYKFHIKAKNNKEINMDIE